MVTKNSNSTNNCSGIPIDDEVPRDPVGTIDEGIEVVEKHWIPERFSWDHGRPGPGSHGRQIARYPLALY